MTDRKLLKLIHKNQIHMQKDINHMMNVIDFLFKYAIKRKLTSKNQNANLGIDDVLRELKINN